MGLTVSRLSKAFLSKPALNGLSFEVAEGAVHGIIGPNGAGKTTAMRMILRIMTPDQGHISWRGRPLDSVPRHHFGYVPEERGLYPKMRLSEQLEFFARLWGLGAQDSRTRVAEWVDRLALHPYLDRRGSELSKGNARKAQMALALLGSPELLVLDEPFEGMDPVNVRLMKDVIREIRRQGTTVLLSSHTMEFIEDLCQSVTVIQAGRAVAHGSLEAVRQSLGYRVLKIAWDELNTELLKDWERARRLTPEKVVDGQERWYRLSETLDSQTLLSEIGAIGDVRFYSVGPPDLEEVYVALVQGPLTEEKS